MKKVIITPKLFKEYQFEITVTVETTTVRKHPQVWLGLQLIRLGAFLCCIGYNQKVEQVVNNSSAEDVTR